MYALDTPDFADNQFGQLEKGLGFCYGDSIPLPEDEGYFLYSVRSANLGQGFRFQPWHQLNEKIAFTIRDYYSAFSFSLTRDEIV